jgi:hypothetical protein
MVSALAYIEETLLCAEVVRLLPKFMAPYVLLDGYLHCGIRLTCAVSSVGLSRARSSPTRLFSIDCCPSPSNAAWSATWQTLVRKSPSTYVVSTSRRCPHIPAETLYRVTASSGLWKHPPRTPRGRQSVSCTS